MMKGFFLAAAVTAGVFAVGSPLGLWDYADLRADLERLADAVGSSVRPDEKIDERETEAFLARYHRDLSDIRCQEGSHGWDYVCRFRGPEGRSHAGVVVDRRQPTHTSSFLPVGQPLPPGPAASATENAAWWAAEADRACVATKARMRLESLERPRGGRLTRRLMLAALAESAPIKRSLVLRLSALSPSAGSGTASRRLLVLLEEDVRAHEEVLRSLQGRWSRTTLREWLRSGHRRSARLEELSRELGAVRCADLFDPEPA
jgi:hypothetical protein